MHLQPGVLILLTFTPQGFMLPSVSDYGGCFVEGWFFEFPTSGTEHE